MPGGLHSRATDGFVYERAAGSTAMMGNEQRDLQGVLADRVGAFVSARAQPATVLNLGCGFGKLERFLFETVPPHTVLIGCDLSAAVLRVAHLRALERGQDVTWVQTPAESVDYCENDSVDVVTSVQLLHELPSPARKAVLNEAHRILAPGGKIMMIDFHPDEPSALELFLYHGHTARNGEPYLSDVLLSPLATDLESIGFGDVRVSPIGAPRADAPAGWRLPWALIEATKGDAGARRAG
jgi:ubiquinone/menaquinone biosynthesis C-methylase UbiE